MSNTAGQPEFEPVERPAASGAPRVPTRSPAVVSTPSMRRIGIDWSWIVRSPELAWGALTISALAVMVGLVMLWADGRLYLAPGQVSSETFAVRAPFEVVDRTAADADRQAVREKTPRVYLMDPRVLPELRVSLENLPRALADVESIDGVTPALREQFALNPISLAAIKHFAGSAAAEKEWADRVERLDSVLRRTPLVDSEAFQTEAVALNEAIELRIPQALSPGTSGAEAAPVYVKTRELMKAGGEQTARLLRDKAAACGFAGPVLDAVSARLAFHQKPTFAYDDAATAERREAAARAVPLRSVRYSPGQLLVVAGDKLTAEKLELLRQERAGYWAALGFWQRAGIISALLASGVLIALALAAYVRTYAPRMVHDPARFAIVASLLALGLVFSCWLGSVEPWIVGVAMTAPTLALAVVLAVVFDRRMALGLGSLLGITSCIAMQQPVGMCAVALCGVGVVAWTLREVRQRNSLIFSGFFSGVAVALATVLLGLMRRPVSPAAVTQILWEAATSGAGATLVGFLALGVLPAIERLFGVTTGMTLVELRDPKQPLLRQLQQRAPGTYNHSLNVAALAEAAAEAIGANGLLAYVGSLYHDVGKMNKPEYFVENQTGGINRHERLTPAMSLLVIVGHVRDGIELAHEHNLPDVLHHFIEAHHGTTLVEYFYHRARKQAEQRSGLPGGIGEGAGSLPSEIEFRYPGPRPRTKEVAIVMVCDAAESATRTLPDPSPTRIDALVRAIAHKRLMDGQFDEADLTLRELHVIIDAISRTLASIHHQRVVYPEGPATKAAPRQAPASGAAVVAGPPATPVQGLSGLTPSVGPGVPESSAPIAAPVTSSPTVPQAAAPTPAQTAAVLTR